MGFLLSLVVMCNVFTLTYLRTYTVNHKKRFLWFTVYIPLVYSTFSLPVNNLY